MDLDADICYQALLAHDPRFDGVFFVGVASTGIYCRPVCPARIPRRGNCTFYPSAAAAERAGFRPCLRCRPELAPGYAQIDSVSRLAADAAGLIEDGALADGSLTDLAAGLNVSARHLRRVIQSEFGVSPIELAQTQRLLLAKRLLTDTALPIGDIAFASGFTSLRRFNALFLERYRLNPTALRRNKAGGNPGAPLISEVAYRPPMCWDALLSFLADRTACGVEWVCGGRYARTLAIGKHRGWLIVEPAANKPALRVEVSASLAPVLLPLIARVKNAFDLRSDPQKIAEQLGGLSGFCAGLRVPGAFDGFELAVRAILGQQISVRAATTLSGRFAAAFGEPIDTPYPQLTHISPTAARITAMDPIEIAALGIVPARSHTIAALARAVAGGQIALERSADVEATLARLKELPGIGEWTAQYIAMRALAWPDAFPHTDLGIMKALGDRDPKAVLATAESWRPWRAYAAMHLWQTLKREVIE